MGPRGRSLRLGIPVGFVAVLLVAGCSNGSGSRLRAYSGASPSGESSVSGSGSATPSAAASLDYRPGDPLGMGAWAELGAVTVRSAREQAVVDAYLRMDNVVLQAFNTHVVDEAALTSTLDGKRLATTRTAIQWRIDNRLWTVNRSVLNVLSVQINGSTATVRVCNFDGTSEVGKDTHIVVQAPGSTGALVTMVQRGGVWRATSGRADPAKCDAPALMATTSGGPSPTR